MPTTRHNMSFMRFNMLDGVVLSLWTLSDGFWISSLDGFGLQTAQALSNPIQSNPFASLAHTTYIRLRRDLQRARR